MILGNGFFAGVLVGFTALFCVLWVIDTYWLTWP